MDLRTKEKCTLSDTELLDKCNEWIDRLIRSGGREWTLRVPVDLNHDPDMVFVELMNRFKALSLIQGEAADQKSLEDFREKLHKAMSEELAYALGIDHADVHVQEALDGGWPLIAQREAAKAMRIAEVEAELESLRSKQEWVAVSERRPEGGKYVLAISNRGLYHVARTYEKDNTYAWMDRAGDYDASYFTHWMPLPPSPTQANGE